MDNSFVSSLLMLFSLDNDLLEIIGLSLRVSLTAVIISTFIGLPLGAALALYKFRGRSLLVILVNTLMGLPPVVVGLCVYLLLSRSGPLGVLSLLYTPAAMIIAQTILITPIIAALSRQTIDDLWQEYAEQLRSLGVTTERAIFTLLWDGRFSLLTTVVAGFGRAIAEVGAVMIVGGNIDHATRVMTTAITLETSKGNLEVAIALGVVLLIISLTINAGAYGIKSAAKRMQG